MMRSEMDAVIGGTSDDLERFFDELAWIRTRQHFGLGFDEAPFSLYDAGVTVEMRAEMVRQLEKLARGCRAAQRSARAQRDHAKIAP